MRFSIVKTVFLKELRETLRDRRSLLVMFGLPLILWPIAALGITALAGSKNRAMTEKPVRVAIQNGQDAQHLAKMVAGDTAQYELVSAADPRKALADRSVDAVIVVPPDAEKRALSAEAVEIRIEVDRSRTESPVVERRVEKLLAAYEKWVVQQRLAASGIDAQAALRPITREVDDISTSGQRLGKMLALMLPNVLLLTGMLGAFFPALSATTTEREAGTLETLLVTPAGRTELLVAKASLVLLTSLLTAALNLVSMSLVLWRAFSMMGDAGALKGSLTISPGALALTYLAAVPTLIFFAALVLVVGLFARNFREANSYATPVMMLPLLTVAVSIAEPPATQGLLVTPMVNTTIIIREALTARVTAGPFLLAFVSSCLYAGIMLSMAARLFSSEQLVNPAWEPLSFKGFGKSKAHRPTRLPGLDTALVLFAFSMLLLLYLTPSPQRHGLLTILAVNQLICIALPTALFARIGRWKWREVFSFYMPRWRAVVGAACLGVGLVPLVISAIILQDVVWPRDWSDSSIGQLVDQAMREHSPLLVAVVLGLLAGTSEELLYRGPIQNALVRKIKLAPALIIGGVLFGAAHLDLHGLPVRAVLGVLLGWVVWRSGSIFPAMLMHMLYDTISLLHGVWRESSLPPGTTVERARELLLSPAALTTPLMLAQIAVGAALVVGGAMLINRGRRAGEAGFPALAIAQPAETAAQGGALQ